MTPAVCVVYQIDIALSIHFIELALSRKLIIEEQRLVACGAQRADGNDVVAPAMPPALVSLEQTDGALIIYVIELAHSRQVIIEEQSCLGGSTSQQRSMSSCGTSRYLFS